MNTIQSQLASARAERARVEAQVWLRAGVEVPYPEDREKLRAYLPHLEALMQLDERRRWRALHVAIDELERHLS